MVLPIALQDLAVPAVSALISFLAYSSQALFLVIEPHPLTFSQCARFNVLVLAIFICYYRTCFTDPGRVPPQWKPPLSETQDAEVPQETLRLRQRWCRRCEASKPPRAHHCKTCKRCILKMDHHCPWTANCVSHTTFPHFARFLFYSVTAMTYLEYFLMLRLQVLWSKRNLPSYLGPSMLQLAHLFVLIITNSLALFALFILLVRTLWCLGANTTTIEGWEIERHTTLVRRARVLGGYLEGPNGTRVRIVKQEFPYDVGIYTNIAQGLGGHIHTWLWPFAATPTVESGLTFPENEFEDPGTSWPPPDPDRMFRFPRNTASATAFTRSLDPEDFRKRQEDDFQRQRYDAASLYRRQPFHVRYANQNAKDVNGIDINYGNENEATQGAMEDANQGHLGDDEGEESWRNSEGERLADFGVDEYCDFYDEDDLPLSELMQRRRKRDGSHER